MDRGLGSAQSGSAPRAGGAGKDTRVTDRRIKPEPGTSAGADQTVACSGAPRIDRPGGKCRSDAACSNRPKISLPGAREGKRKSYKVLPRSERRTPHLFGPNCPGWPINRKPFDSPVQPQHADITTVTKRWYSFAVIKQPRRQRRLSNMGCPAKALYEQKK